MHQTLKHDLIKKVGLTLSVLLFSFSAVMAQEVSGILLNTDESPLIGASVQIDGTSVGTITDLDGKCSLKAQPGDVLSVKYLGFPDSETFASFETILQNPGC